MIKQGSFALIGFLVGVGAYHYSNGIAELAVRREIEAKKKEAVIWLNAHRARDREDEKLTQTMQKILNRIEIMGVLPRHKK